MIRRYLRSKHLLPLGVIFFVELLLFFTNYTPGTYLIGWDNVMPEFNFPVNLWRSIASIWQEYRGVGLLDGMGHAANFFHTLILWLLSFILPRQLLRYVFIMATHGVGMIGIYVLIQKLTHTTHARSIAVLGSLFYGLNAFTIQMYYAPLEAFSVHFAALPWLAFTYYSYLSQGKRRDLGFFWIVAILTTIQFFVTPLFFPIILTLTAISFSQFHGWKRVLRALGGFITIQAFWLLPYVYSIPYVGPVVKEAKINQMSSQEIFLRNQAYGDVFSIVGFRGFSLDFSDTTAENSRIWMMDSWRNHIQVPLVGFLYGTFFGIVVIGSISIFLRSRRKDKTALHILPFVGLFATSFFMLATDTPILRDLNGLMRNYIPFFGEAFRFTFTKFSLLYAFSFSVLFAWGIETCIEIVRRYRPIVYRACFIVIALSILFVGYPAFTGQFLYSHLRIKLPSEYVQFFSYMEALDPHGRLALLPQPEYWSWKHYRFGLRGSGFTWYGIPQPTMDRAFDPWSAENENYYWELTKALYSKDAEQLENVLDKYDIRYILIDENVLSQTHPLALYIDDIRSLLAINTRVHFVQSFGSLHLYEREESTRTFISLSSYLPVVAPTSLWNDFDTAYRDRGDYREGSISSFVYPYRSLFTKRSIEEREVDIAETVDVISIKTPVNIDVSQVRLDAASRVSHDGSIMVANIPKAEALLYDSEDFGELKSPLNVKNCGISTEEVRSTLVEESDGQSLRFDDMTSKSCLSFGISGLWHTDGYVVAIESRHVTGQALRFALINATAKRIEIEVDLPLAKEWKTTYLILPPLASDGLGYNVYVSNDSIGRYESTNDLRSIRVYRIPYNELTAIHSGEERKSSLRYSPDITGVYHPVSSVYIVRPRFRLSEDTVLTLSQSFHPGWRAYTVNFDHPWEVYLPFIFGRELKEHIKVNNWANGWDISDLEGREDATVVVFFFPQLLQWIGFALLPLPLLWLGVKGIRRIRIS